MAGAAEDGLRARQVSLENHDVVGIESRRAEQAYAGGREGADDRGQHARHIQVERTLDHQRAPAPMSPDVLRSKLGLADDRQLGGVTGDSEKAARERPGRDRLIGLEPADSQKLSLQLQLQFRSHTGQGTGPA